MGHLVACAVLCSGSAEFFVAQKQLEVLVTLVARTIVLAKIKAEVPCCFMRHISRRPHLRTEYGSRNDAAFAFNHVDAGLMAVLCVWMIPAHGLLLLSSSH